MTPTPDTALQIVARAVEAATRSIAPAWPLDAQVAVNPFLGQTTEPLARTAVRLGRAGGVPVTMPRSWYAARIAEGRIDDSHLARALEASPWHDRPGSVEALKALAATDREPPAPLPTIADLAAGASGTDWPSIVAERIGAWAGSHFDQGQALWRAPQQHAAWPAYRLHASHDLAPEIAGLAGFARHAVAAPDDAMTLIARAVQQLGIGAAALEGYFHRLLFSLGGWAQYARYRLWCAELDGATDGTLTDLLAIRLLWEEALWLQHGEQCGEAWQTALSGYAAPVAASADTVVDEILQDAFERAGQASLAATLAAPALSPEPSARPLLHAAFCIDVRSEVFRRALESVAPDIRTSGFAGFFGLLTSHRGFASDVEERRHPVLLNPSLASTAATGAAAGAEARARHGARARRAWGRFRLAAVSSFAFVEAAGPVYLGKLLRDTLRIGKQPVAEPEPHLDPQPDLATRTGMAETVLKAMSMTGDFARVVVLAGHGAHVVNNPLASSLQCGACGGHAGDVNARLLARLLNDAEVREGLRERGIAIPDDTVFVGALHDTTTDAVVLFPSEANGIAHHAALGQVRTWLAEAGRIARTERALRLPLASHAADIGRRARDWAETRPEWGLAGCSAFIAAPRARTRGRSLGGRAFLHDYDWQADSRNGFPVLELILTAPVVVASWISLQYYGSTVAPETFGSGNKLLHNVVGGFGVFEGNGGNLRAGLPLQSVHDGESHAHEPVRLSVCVEAPREAMTDILQRHPAVRALFDNRWLHLFALDAEGRMAWRYAGDLDWIAEPPAPGHGEMRPAAEACMAA